MAISKMMAATKGIHCLPTLDFLSGRLAHNLKPCSSTHDRYADNLTKLLCQANREFFPKSRLVNWWTNTYLFLFAEVFLFLKNLICGMTWQTPSFLKKSTTRSCFLWESRVWFFLPFSAILIFLSATVQSHQRPKSQWKHIRTIGLHIHHHSDFFRIVLPSLTSEVDLF